MNYFVLFLLVLPFLTTQAAPRRYRSSNLAPGQEAQLVQCILDAVSQIVNSSMSFVPGLDGQSANDILAGLIQIGTAIITNLPAGDIAAAGTEVVQGAIQVATGAASSISVDRISRGVRGILMAVSQIVGASKSQEILQQCTARIAG